MIRLASKPGEMIANVDIQPGDTVVVSKAGVCSWWEMWPRRAGS